MRKDKRDLLSKQQRKVRREKRFGGPMKKEWESTNEQEPKDKERILPEGDQFQELFALDNDDSSTDRKQSYNKNRNR